MPNPTRIPMYTLEDGRYACYLGGQRLFETDEVAILFDRTSSTLLKHGPPERVAAEATMMRQAYLAIGAVGMAADCTVIQGRFSLEELNQAVQSIDYVGQLYRKLQAASSPTHL
jgi:hypothetical protein